MSSAARRLDVPLPTGKDDRGKLSLVLPDCGIGPRLAADSDEEVRWSEYRLSLHSMARSSAQHERVEQIWRSARSRFPGLRYPRAGRDEDGVYHLTWAFEDLRDITFGVEVEENGVVSWFFRDRATDVTDGTEEEGEESLPELAYAYLERFRR